MKLPSVRINEIRSTLGRNPSESTESMRLRALVMYLDETHQEPSEQSEKEPRDCGCHSYVIGGRREYQYGHMASYHPEWKEQASEEKCHYREHRHLTVTEMMGCPCCKNNLKQEDVVPAKPQEEPKCCEKCKQSTNVSVVHPLYGSMLAEGVGFYCTNYKCPCHKESESKDGNPVYVMTEILGQRLKEIYESNIVLPRPKGMSIGEALHEFRQWLKENGKLFTTPNHSDETFLKLWQEWLKSISH